MPADASWVADIGRFPCRAVADLATVSFFASNNEEISADHRFGTGRRDGFPPEIDKARQPPNTTVPSAQQMKEQKGRLASYVRMSLEALARGFPFFEHVGEPYHVHLSLFRNDPWNNRAHLSVCSVSGRGNIQKRLRRCHRVKNGGRKATGARGPQSVSSSSFSSLNFHGTPYVIVPLVQAATRQIRRYLAHNQDSAVDQWRASRSNDTL